MQHHAQERSRSRSRSRTAAASAAADTAWIPQDTASPPSPAFLRASFPWAIAHPKQAADIRATAAAAIAATPAVRRGAAEEGKEQPEGESESKGKTTEQRDQIKAQTKTPAAGRQATTRSRSVSEKDGWGILGRPCSPRRAARGSKTARRRGRGKVSDSRSPRRAARGSGSRALASKTARRRGRRKVSDSRSPRRRARASNTAPSSMTWCRFLSRALVKVDAATARTRTARSRSARR